MTAQLPPQNLDCPDPGGCTVAVERLSALAADDSLPTAHFLTEHHWFRVYGALDGHTQPNPGFGDTRFTPFDSLTGAQRVPFIYLAADLEAALLESSLHNVSEHESRVIDEMALLGKLHAHVVPPHELHLVDLRDSALDSLMLRREHVSSSSPEHYPCTRRVARAIHASPSAPQGIVWH